MAEDPFEAALRRARATGDWSAVITMYIDAARGESEAFYLTHAYVHALETGDTRARALKQRLVALGADLDDADN
ncbi:hypothetical protein [Gymnodinialimonas sp.]